MNLAELHTLSDSSCYPPAFTRAVNRVLADEGGYVNNPLDPGGETKFGITRRNYPHLDIAALSRDEAIVIYYRDWWQRFSFSRLPGPIGVKLFDLAINIGADHAVKCLQRALRACGKPVAEDGVLGPVTGAAASSVNQVALMATLRCEAAGYYRVLAALERGTRDNGDRAFLHGWLKRAYA